MWQLLETLSRPTQDDPVTPEPRPPGHTASGAARSHSVHPVLSLGHESLLLFRSIRVTFVEKTVDGFTSNALSLIESNHTIRLHMHVCCTFLSIYSFLEAKSFILHRNNFSTPRVLGANTFQLSKTFLEALKTLWNFYCAQPSQSFPLWTLVSRGCPSSPVWCLPDLLQVAGLPQSDLEREG